MLNILVLLIFISFFIFDIYTNALDGVARNHIVHEIVLCIFSLGLLSWQIILITRSKKKLIVLQSELLETKKSYFEWKTKSQEPSKHLSRLIDEQMENWSLSPSEKDIALLLIKGLSMKEIAEIRQTHEKTVRQQAATLYKKSGLSGRQELSAFFLEDILAISPVS